MRALTSTCVLALTGCGSGLWFITPRPDTTHYEVTKLAQLRVTATPPGATVLVDGAEAGPAPRSVAVPYKELRRQRRQMIWPAVAGTLVDLAASVLFTVATADESHDPGPTLFVGALGAGIMTLDFYLIAGHSVVNEGVDVLPMPVEIGVRAPGYVDSVRRVRVPDFSELRFNLVPGAPTTLAPPSQ